MFDTSGGIIPAGINRINPMLTNLAQREQHVDFLAVLRAAKQEGMEIILGGRNSNMQTPPDPTLPFSVFWFDDDHDRYGRIGVGMTNVNHKKGESSSVAVMTEESWQIREAEEVDDPCTDTRLMRWDQSSGWLNDHVIYLVEARPYRFLINWCMTGYRPAIAQQSSQPQVDAHTKVIL
jgi:hypothetical protein